MPFASRQHEEGNTTLRSLRTYRSLTEQIHSMFEVGRLDKDYQELCELVN